MTDNANGSAQDALELVAEIVSAYVSKNSIPISELPALIGKVYESIVSLGSDASSSDDTSEARINKLTSAQIRKSICSDGLVSFIDGKTYKTLKRHLTSRGLDPRSYRERYGLPDDYPMVAPSYSAQRSALAKAIGLGIPGVQDGLRRTGTDG